MTYQQFYPVTETEHQDSFGAAASQEQVNTQCVYNPTAILWVPITMYTLCTIAQVMTSIVSVSCIEVEPPGSLPAPHQSHRDKTERDEVGLDTDQCLCPAWPHCKEVNVPSSGSHLDIPGQHGHPQ